jgi:hypothetical protein
LASIDREAQRAAPQPTAISGMSDDQIVRSQLSGFALMLVTSESIDLPGIKAGQELRAKVDVTPQLRVLPPAEADRLRAVMDDVEVRLGLRLTGAMLAQPRLSVTVDSVTFRGQDLPVAMYELPQIMRVKPELAHTVVRGPVPDAYWELPAKTGMTFRAKPREADRGQERGSKMTERPGAKTR